jgi:hypothetical protein
MTFVQNQKNCYNILGAREDFCSYILGAKQDMSGAKQDFCSKTLDTKEEFC